MWICVILKFSKTIISTYGKCVPVTSLNRFRLVMYREEEYVLFECEYAYKKKIYIDINSAPLNCQPKQSNPIKIWNKQTQPYPTQLVGWPIVHDHVGVVAPPLFRLPSSLLSDTQLSSDTARSSLPNSTGRRSGNFL